MGNTECGNGRVSRVSGERASCGEGANVTGVMKGLRGPSELPGRGAPEAQPAGRAQLAGGRRLASSLSE